MMTGRSRSVSPPTPRSPLATTQTVPGRIVAHRGGAGGAPENTLAAFRHAHRQAVTWIECDVTLLGDGTAIIHYDETFERTTNGNGLLSSRDLAYVRELDAGNWFSPAFQGEPVPTLVEALEVFDQLQLRANLELKTHAGESAQLAETVADHLSKRPTGGAEFLVSSFDDATLKTFHRLAPKIPVALLHGKVPSDWQDRAAEVAAHGIIASHRRIDASLIGEIRETGMFVAVYTANEPANVAPLWEAGLSSVITDYPDRFSREWLGRP